MAEVIYRFQYIHNPQIDLFFIQDTYFEVPKTVPMDLYTFIHFCLGYDEMLLDALPKVWHTIQKNGCSFSSELSFDDLFNQIEKDRLINDFECSSNYEKVVEQMEASAALSKIVAVPNNTIENILDEFGSYFTIADNLKNIDYYFSRYYLMLYMWNETDSLLDLSLCYEAVQLVYQHCPFDLFMVPHQFRNAPYFNKIIQHSKKNYLLPDVKNKWLTDNPVLNRNEVLKTVSKYGILYRFLDKKYQKDLEIVLVCLKNNPDIYPYLDKSMKELDVVKKLKTIDDMMSTQLQIYLFEL